MDRFEILKYLEFDVWHSEWPLELLKGAITKDNATGNLLLQLKMCNICDKEIKSAYFTIECFNDVGNLVNKDKKYAYQDINIQPYRDFGDDVAIELNDNTIRKINVILEQVVFYNDEVCKYERDEGIIIPKLVSIDTLDSELLEELKKDYEEYSFEHKVKYLPFIIEQKAWNCCCGRINSLKNEECVNCNRSRTIQLEKINKEYLKNLNRIILEKKLKNNEKENIEKLKNKKSKIKIITLISICLLISIFVGKKIFYKYNLSNKIENNSKTQDFITINRSLDINDMVCKLENNGTVTVNTKFKDKNINTSSWNDVVSIDCDSGNIVGLKKDGTVVATGDNDYGQCNVSNWKNIVEVKCKNKLTVGIDMNGEIFKTGFSETEFDTFNWERIEKIYLEENYIAGLKKDGTVVIAGSEDNNFDVSSWNDISDIKTDYSCIVGLKKDGTVVITGENYYNSSNLEYWNEIDKIETYSNMAIVGIKKDGTIMYEFGDSFRKLNIETWSDIKSIKIGARYGFSDEEYKSYLIPYIVGLKNNGQVVYDSDKEIKFLIDVLEWKDIDKICLGDKNIEFIMGIKSNGEKKLIGKEETLDLF
ncbi:hypothetical protein ACTPEO_05670 [Clostridioides difficile]